MRVPEEDRLPPALLPLFWAVGVAAFAPALGVGLASDDFVLLEAVTRRGAAALATPGDHEMLRFFRPLALGSLGAEWALGGGRPWVLHLSAVLIHATAAWMLMALGRELERGGSRWPLAAGMLFLLAPVHAEPVAWISGRADLLAGMFGLAALAAYARGRRCGRMRWLIASGLALAAALAAKESAVTLPFAMAAWELTAGRPLWRDGGARRPLAVLKWPLAILAFYLVARRVALGEWVGGYGSERLLGARPLAWWGNGSIMLVRSLLPPLPDYPAWLPTGLLAAAWVLVIGSAARVAHLARRDGTGAVPLFLAAGFLVTLAPVINLSVSKITTEGERFAYLPSAFVLAAAAWTGARLAGGARARRLLLGGTLALCALTLSSSLVLWRSAGRLAGQILDQAEGIVAQAPMERIDVLTLPDRLDGAFVLRNGLVEGLRLRGVAPERAARVRVHRTHPIGGIGVPYRASVVAEGIVLAPLTVTGEAEPPVAAIGWNELGETPEHSLLVYYSASALLRLMPEGGPQN